MPLVHSTPHTISCILSLLFPFSRPSPVQPYLFLPVLLAPLFSSPISKTSCPFSAKTVFPFTTSSLPPPALRAFHQEAFPCSPSLLLAHSKLQLASVDAPSHSEVASPHPFSDKTQIPVTLKLQHPPFLSPPSSSSIKLQFLRRHFSCCLQGLLQALPVAFFVRQSLHCNPPKTHDLPSSKQKLVS